MKLHVASQCKGIERLPSLRSLACEAIRDEVSTAQYCTPLRGATTSNSRVIAPDFFRPEDIGALTSFSM